MPPASIGMRRELPTENDKAQLTNARRSIRSRYTNPEWPLRLFEVRCGGNDAAAHASGQLAQEMGGCGYDGAGVRSY